jgi:enoyl-CoA hydratase
MSASVNGEPTVTYVADGPIGRLTLNRPDKRNAMSAELRADFSAALDQFEADPDVRLAILSGRGPSFCGGFDLSATSASVQSTVGDPWGDRRRLRSWIELALRIREGARPVIAQVHGHCLAGGILWPLCSDIVFAAEDCVFGWPRLPVGSGFMDGALALLIGERRAKQISFVVGSRIDGREAERWGFANFVVPADRLEEEVERFARRLTKMPRTGLEIRKAAITRATMGLSFREALLAGVEWDVIAHADPDITNVRLHVKDVGLKAAIEEFESDDPPTIDPEQQETR